jgi:hypothetical protein
MRDRVGLCSRRAVHDQVYIAQYDRAAQPLMKPWGERNAVKRDGLLGHK